MTYNIAVAGKGGVGKTSLTGLLIDTLVKQKKDPILVVDADANCNLYEVLGSEEPETIGHIREVANMTEKNGDSFPGGMTKAQFLQWQLSMILEEGDSIYFDSNYLHGMKALDNKPARFLAVIMH